MNAAPDWDLHPAPAPDASRHLIHIGFPKAGSTYLQAWFEAHPELAYRHGGLAGYHTIFQLTAEMAAGAVDRPAWRVTSHEGLSMPWREAADQTGQSGNAAHDVDETKRAQHRTCALLSDLFPSACVLIVTRGFRSVVRSAYSQYVRAGGPHGFDQLIEPMSGIWNYDELIAAYRRAFGDRVLVLPYEMLDENSAAFLAAIARWLGIGSHPMNAERINAALSNAELIWYPRWTRALLRIRGGGRLLPLYRSMIFRGRLRGLAALADRIRPSTSDPIGRIREDYVTRMAAGAVQLIRDDAFADYKDHYR